MKTKLTSTRLLILLLLLVLVGATANVMVMLRLASPQSCNAAPPCAAIPRRFVMEHPDCADELLRSMNVTNVRVRRIPQANSSHTLGDEGTV